ncbi:MAG: hypothetical protein GX062_07550 [Firmicutes bacterium]|nr:hypothetical protein [Bacillota bacterium]
MMRARTKRLKLPVVTIVCLVLVLALAVPTGAAPITAAAQEAAERGVAYLKGMQNPDGGMPVQPGGKSDALVTAWVALALRAQGENPETLLSFLQADKTKWDATTDYARIALAVQAAGGDPHRVGGRDLPALLKARQRPDGSFGNDQEEGLINAHVWSILALAATEGEIPRAGATRVWLLNQQNEDGGFGYASGLLSDVDNTAAAIQALVVLGERGKPLARALNFMRQASDDGGAWGGFAGGANVATAAWGLQALAAAGEDPLSSPWTIDGKGPVQYILSLQEDDGCFAYTPGLRSQPVWMTAQALLGLSGVPFPAAAGFRDVPPGDPAAMAVHKLVRRGAIAGYSDFAFHPQDNLTRAQFAKVLCLALTDYTAAEAAGFEPSPFSDVPAWAEPYVSVVAAPERAWLKGVGAGRFAPDEPVTGAQVATVLLRASGKANAVPVTNPWYAGYVAAAGSEGLLWDGFDPLAPATRAQCALALAALLD